MPAAGVPRTVLVSEMLAFLLYLTVGSSMTALTLSALDLRVERLSLGVPHRTQCSPPYRCTRRAFFDAAKLLRTRGCVPHTDFAKPVLMMARERQACVVAFGFVSFRCVLQHRPGQILRVRTELRTCQLCTRYATCFTAWHDRRRQQLACYRKIGVAVFR